MCAPVHEPLSNARSHELVHTHSPTPTHAHLPPPPNAVIKDFCTNVGVNNKQVQGVVRLAKKNGEWLGFLA